MSSRLVAFAGVARRIHTSSRESPVESPAEFPEDVPLTRPSCAPCVDNPGWFSRASPNRDSLVGKDHRCQDGWSSHFPAVQWDCHRRLATLRRRTRLTSRRRPRRQPGVVVDACQTAPMAGHAGTAPAFVRQASAAKRVTTVCNPHKCHGLGCLRTESILTPIAPESEMCVNVNVIFVKVQLYPCRSI